MRTFLLICVMALAAAASGCSGFMLASGAREVAVDTLMVRRMIVQNDWCYVPDCGTMYRRYLPTKGWWLFHIEKSNVALVRAGGKVSKNNPRIWLYGNYEKAIAEVPPGTEISAESKKYVPQGKQTAVKRMFR